MTKRILSLFIVLTFTGNATVYPYTAGSQGSVRRRPRAALRVKLSSGENVFTQRFEQAADNFAPQNDPSSAILSEDPLASNEYIAEEMFGSADMWDSVKQILRQTGILSVDIPSDAGLSRLREHYSSKIGVIRFLDGQRMLTLVSYVMEKWNTGYFGAYVNKKSDHPGEFVIFDVTALKEAMLQREHNKSQAQWQQQLDVPKVVADTLMELAGQIIQPPGPDDEANNRTKRRVTVSNMERIMSSYKGNGGYITRRMVEAALQAFCNAYGIYQELDPEKVKQTQDSITLTRLSLFARGILLSGWRDVTPDDLNETILLIRSMRPVDGHGPYYIQDREVSYEGKLKQWHTFITQEKNKQNLTRVIEALTNNMSIAPDFSQKLRLIKQLLDKIDDVVEKRLFVEALTPLFKKAIQKDDKKIKKQLTSFCGAWQRDQFIAKAGWEPLVSLISRKKPALLEQTKIASNVNTMPETRLFNKEVLAPNLVGDRRGATDAPFDVAIGLQEIAQSATERISSNYNIKASHPSQVWVMVSAIDQGPSLRSQQVLQQLHEFLTDTAITDNLVPLIIVDDNAAKEAVEKKFREQYKKELAALCYIKTMDDIARDVIAKKDILKINNMSSDAARVFVYNRIQMLYETNIAPHTRDELGGFSLNELYSKGASPDGRSSGLNASSLRFFGKRLAEGIVNDKGVPFTPDELRLTLNALDWALITGVAQHRFTLHQSLLEAPRMLPIYIPADDILAHSIGFKGSYERFPFALPLYVVTKDADEEDLIAQMRKNALWPSAGINVISEDQVENAINGEPHIITGFSNSLAECSLVNGSARFPSELGQMSAQKKYPDSQIITWKPLGRYASVARREIVWHHVLAASYFAAARSQDNVKTSPFTSATVAPLLQGNNVRNLRVDRDIDDELRADIEAAKAQLTLTLLASGHKLSSLERMLRYISRQVNLVEKSVLDQPLEDIWGSLETATKSISTLEEAIQDTVYSVTKDPKRASLIAQVFVGMIAQPVDKQARVNVDPRAGLPLISGDSSVLKEKEPGAIYAISEHSSVQKPLAGLMLLKELNELKFALIAWQDVASNWTNDTVDVIDWKGLDKATKVYQEKVRQNISIIREAISQIRAWSKEQDSLASNTEQTYINIREILGLVTKYCNEPYKEMAQNKIGALIPEREHPVLLQEFLIELASFIAYELHINGADTKNIQDMLPAAFTADFYAALNADIIVDIDRGAFLVSHLGTGDSMFLHDGKVDRFSAANEDNLHHTAFTHMRDAATVILTPNNDGRARGYFYERFTRDKYPQGATLSVTSIMKDMLTAYGAPTAFNARLLRQLQIEINNAAAIGLIRPTGDELLGAPAFRVAVPLLERHYEVLREHLMPGMVTRALSAEEGAAFRNTIAGLLLGEVMGTAVLLSREVTSMLDLVPVESYDGGVEITTFYAERICELLGMEKTPAKTSGMKGVLAKVRNGFASNMGVFWSQMIALQKQFQPMNMSLLEYTRALFVAIQPKVFFERAADITPYTFNTVVEDLREYRAFKPLCERAYSNIPLGVEKMGMFDKDALAGMDDILNALAIRYGIMPEAIMHELLMSVDVMTFMKFFYDENDPGENFDRIASVFNFMCDLDPAWGSMYDKFMSEIGRDVLDVATVDWKEPSVQAPPKLVVSGANGPDYVRIGDSLKVVTPGLAIDPFPGWPSFAADDFIAASNWKVQAQDWKDIYTAPPANAVARSIGAPERLASNTFKATNIEATHVYIVPWSQANTTLDTKINLFLEFLKKIGTEDTDAKAVIIIAPTAGDKRRIRAAFRDATGKYLDDIVHVRVSGKDGYPDRAAWWMSVCAMTSAQSFSQLGVFTVWDAYREDPEARSVLEQIKEDLDIIRKYKPRKRIASGDLLLTDSLLTEPDVLDLLFTPLASNMNKPKWLGDTYAQTMANILPAWNTFMDTISVVREHFNVLPQFATDTITEFCLAGDPNAATSIFDDVTNILQKQDIPKAEEQVVQIMELKRMLTQIERDITEIAITAPEEMILLCNRLYPEQVVKALSKPSDGVSLAGDTINYTAKNYIQPVAKAVLATAHITDKPSYNLRQLFPPVIEALDGLEARIRQTRLGQELTDQQLIVNTDFITMNELGVQEEEGRWMDTGQLVVRHDTPQTRQGGGLLYQKARFIWYCFDPARWGWLSNDQYAFMVELSKLSDKDLAERLAASCDERGNTLQALCELDLMHFNHEVGSHFGIMNVQAQLQSKGEMIWQAWETLALWREWIYRHKNSAQRVKSMYLFKENTLESGVDLVEAYMLKENVVETIKDILTQGRPEGMASNRQFTQQAQVKLTFKEMDVRACQAAGKDALWWKIQEGALLRYCFDPAKRGFGSEEMRALAIYNASLSAEQLAQKIVSRTNLGQGRSKSALEILGDLSQEKFQTAIYQQVSILKIYAEQFATSSIRENADARKIIAPLRAKARAAYETLGLWAEWIYRHQDREKRVVSSALFPEEATANTPNLLEALPWITNEELCYLSMAFDLTYINNPERRNLPPSPAILSFDSAINGVQELVFQLQKMIAQETQSPTQPPTAIAQQQGNRMHIMLGMSQGSKSVLQIAKKELVPPERHEKYPLDSLASLQGFLAYLQADGAKECVAVKDEDAYFNFRIFWVGPAEQIASNEMSLANVKVPVRKYFSFATMTGFAVGGNDKKIKTATFSAFPVFIADPAEQGRLDAPGLRRYILKETEDYPQPFEVCISGQRENKEQFEKIMVLAEDFETDDDITRERFKAMYNIIKQEPKRILQVIAFNNTEKERIEQIAVKAGLQPDVDFELCVVPWMKAFFDEHKEDFHNDPDIDGVRFALYSEMLQYHEIRNEQAFGV